MLTFKKQELCHVLCNVEQLVLFWRSPCDNIERLTKHMKFLGNPSSGSLAGTTFSHNRAGQYQRNRRAPVQPIGTGRRAFIRAAFGSASQAWQALSPTNQAAWTAYAMAYPVTDALGQSITLTGQQMFVSVGVQLINTGNALPTIPPLSNTQDDLSPITLVWGTLALPTMVVGWTAGAAANWVLVAAAAPVSTGVNFQKTFWQATYEGASTASIDIITNYETQFGTTSNGQKIFIKVTPVNQYGVTGVPTIMSSVVTRS